MPLKRLIFLLFCLILLFGNSKAFSQQTTDIINLNIINNGASVKLSWHLLNEVEADHFVIERGTDTINFTDIARVTANNKTGSNYFFSDDDPLKSASYYRITMADKNGIITQSKLLYTYINTGKVIVYPSPATNILHVQHCPVAKLNASIIVTDILGKPVKQIALQKAATRLDIDVTGLTTGVYILCVDDGGIRTSTRFLKN